MKRDWDLVRLVLLDFEEGHRGYELCLAEGYDMPAISAHVRMLEDGGFIEGVAWSAGGFGFPANPILTWTGHDFLAAIRDEGVWKKTKSRIAGVASVTFDIVKGVAGNFLSGELGIGGE